MWWHFKITLLIICTNFVLYTKIMITIICKGIIIIIIIIIIIRITILIICFSTVAIGMRSRHKIFRRMTVTS